MSNKDNIADFNNTEIDSVEFAAMETENERAQREDNIFEYTHRFKKPITYNGKEYEELNFDFDSLSGQDILNIDYEMEVLGVNIAVRELNGRYQMAYAAKACKEPIGSDVFAFMRAADFLKISRKVKTFLLVAE
jgi:hypothetical protein